MGTVDAMTWFRLEDTFYSHPKVMKAGNASVGLWVRCCTYSASYLLDGRVPMDIAHLYGTRRDVERLIDTGLWVIDNGDYLVPDFTQYNPTREEVESERDKKHAARSEAGRLGGIASGISRRSNSEAGAKQT